jgi:REP-associated tyrosine transposase
LARMKRVVVPGYPHHVTQRGIRRQKTFFCIGDYRYYLELMAEACRASDTEVWAYCLMPNHVHLIMVPAAEDGLRASLGEAHRRYTRYINFREGWRGHLWQERFHSFPMDEEYLLAAVRYVELNPVKAKLCRMPQDWQWSSTRAHLTGRDDLLARVAPMLDRVTDWDRYLASDRNRCDGLLDRHTRTGRPLGDEHFVSRLESLTGTVLARKRPGRKPKAAGK